MQKLTQIRSLFSTQDEKNEPIKIEEAQSMFAKTSELDLQVTKLVEEIEGYFTEIRELQDAGYHFSHTKGDFRYTQDLIAIASVGSVVGGGVSLGVLPEVGFIGGLVVLGLNFMVAYKITNKKTGIYAKRLKKIKATQATLKRLFNNEEFKISLVLNIEKNFNVLEERFKSKLGENHHKTATLSLVKNDGETNISGYEDQHENFGRKQITENLKLIKEKKNSVLNSLKGLLVENDMNNLSSILDVLITVEGIEKETKKLLKIDKFNQEIDKSLSKVNVTKEENEISEDQNEAIITEKIRSLL